MAIVLIDMDGCVVNLWDSMGAIMRRNGFIPQKEDELKDWDIKKIYKDHILQSEAYRALNSPGVFLGAEPRDGAVQAVKELAIEHDVWLVTTLWPGNRACYLEKQLWVKNYLGPNFISRIVTTTDKTLVRGDILIDDKPEITGVCVPSWKQILFHQGYNASVNLPRIVHWSQAKVTVQQVVEMSHKAHAFTTWVHKAKPGDSVATGSK